MTSVRHRLDQTLEMPEAIGTSFPAQHLLHLPFFGNELQSLGMDLDAAAFESKDENAQKTLERGRGLTHLRRA
jgi:hypothetical protein